MKKEDLLKPGNSVEIETIDGIRLKGIILPRYSIYDPRFITLKLENGYNIGILKDNIKNVSPVKLERKIQTETPLMLQVKKEGVQRGKVVIVGTGGTIASKIDYETGGVKPVINAEELLEAIPEIGEIAVIETEVLFNIFSEDMTPSHWEKIAAKVYEKIVQGEYSGVIVAHGTDTLAYTAAALSFALRNIPVPIALVGSQRSSDRPSSDSAFNLISAVLYATSNINEVAVVMHGTTSDTYALAHRGVRVRKMHSSRRDAFQSIDSIPLAKIYPYRKKVIILRKDARMGPSKEQLIFKPKFSDKVALLKYYPGMQPWIIEEYVDRGIEGIIIEGTGLGHVGEQLIESIRKAVKENVIVAITTQCIFGTVNLNVYSKGRKLLEAGVIPAEDMLGETAMVKLSWLLANYENRLQVKKLFTENLVGEIEKRRPLNIYPRWYHGE